MPRVDGGNHELKETPLPLVGQTVVDTGVITDSLAQNLVSSVDFEGFKLPVRIEQLHSDRIPELTSPVSYNDDLHLSCFAPDRTKWAGEQRKGIAYNIPDATSHADHVYKAMKQPFHLSTPTPFHRSYLPRLNSSVTPRAR